jgi:hypothetical protein
MDDSHFDGGDSPATICCGDHCCKAHRSFFGGGRDGYKKGAGSFGPREYDTLRVVKIPNGGCLNRILKKMGVPYFRRSEPDSTASWFANRKRKAEVVKKPATKKANTGTARASSSRVVPSLPRVGPTKKVGVFKISHLKARPGPCGMSAIELVLAKPVGMSKKILLLDVAALSHTHTTGTATTCTAWVRAFDNLDDDSSPDVHEAPSSGMTMEKPTSPPPSVSSEFLLFNFMILTMGPDGFFL